MLKLSDFIMPAAEWNHNVWPSGHWYSGRQPSRPIYDPTICRRIHAGGDFAAPWGSPLISPHEGEVVVVGWQNSGIGNVCITKHEEVLIDQAGPFFEEVVTVFHRPGHMAPDSRWSRSRMLVKVGARVEQGQPLGQVGNSGSSAGAHVHASLTVGRPEWLDPALDLHLDPEQAFTGQSPGYYFRWKEDDMAMVEDIQRNLNAEGFTDDAGRALVIDGNWGSRTGQAHAEMVAAAASGGGVLGPFDARITPK